MTSKDFGRFSDPALMILISLAGGDKHGYAMMEDIEQISGDRPGPGTLYGALSRLEERRLVEALESEVRRRPYRITPDGLAFLEEQLEMIQALAHIGLDRLGAS
jgi:DNA-binding PadR family transcriptional regulator